MVKLKGHYGCIDFSIKIGLLKLEGSRIVLNFGVRIVLYIHGSLFTFGLADTSVTIGLCNTNLSVSFDSSGLRLA